MTKTLIIAEKPSVANDIAKSLGGFTKQGDYFESDQYVLTSAVGHLLEIRAPEEYEVKRGKWSFANLPVIPPDFALEPIAKTESRLKMLNKLIKRKDISEIINACDAGREGELIFRLIAQYTKAKQPVKRLWLQSMTPNAIREGFKHLRGDEEMQPLAKAARSRSEADWLIGINGTRAMTAFNSKEGGFFLTTVGRVQTPTLSIVVQREEKIKNFVSRDYWEVHAEFVCAQGVYEGRWLDAAFKKDEADPGKRAERLWSRAAADSIVTACLGKQGTVTEESKPTTSISPALFDLTSLQREANARFGFSAKNTLALAQALYEKHKVLTYPRTDSRHLPEDYLQTSMQTLECLSENANYQTFAFRFWKTGGFIRTNAYSTTRKYPITLRSSRRPSRRKTCPNRNRNCTIWSQNGLWPYFSRPLNFWSQPVLRKWQAIASRRGRIVTRPRLAGDLRKGNACFRQGKRERPYSGTASLEGERVPADKALVEALATEPLCTPTS